ncbi:MAG: type IV secretion system DNA-binding domain-containing protein [Patescibacteria group bacterium]
MDFFYTIGIVIGSIVAGGFLLWAIYLIIKNIWRNQESFRRTLDMSVLQVRVQKQTPESDSKKQPKEVIAVAEHLYASFYSIYTGAWRNKILGEKHISIEIATRNGLTDFYVVVPKELVELVRKQMNAQLPDAIIDEVQDGYNIFQENSYVEAANLTFNKNFMYPIKTYDQMESDPLNNITNALSKLADDEGAAIQFIIRPIDNVWHRKGKLSAHNMQQGKPIYEQSWIMKVLGFIGQALQFILQNLQSQAAGDDKSLRRDEDKPVHLTQVQQDMIKALEEKSSKVGFETHIRIVSSAHDQISAKNNLDNIFSAFSQFLFPDMNGFKRVNSNKDKIIKDYIFRRFVDDSRMVLNTKELATVIHFPNQFVDTPNINWLLAKRAPMPPDAPTSGLKLGINVYRGVRKNVFIEERGDGRGRHMYILGRTGSGKTEFLFSNILQDMRSGKGLCVLDPHGDLAEKCLLHVPRERADDVIYFDPGGDLDMPMGLNLFEARTPEEKELRSMSALNIMIKMFGEEIFSPRLQDYFRNGCLTLMADDENPGTIIDIVNLFTDDEYQMEKVAKLTNPTVKSWWIKVFGSMGAREKEEMIPYFAAKFGQFTTNVTVRNTLGQSRSSFNIREVMDQGKILIANLSKGKLGELNSNLVGMILAEEITMAALSRTDQPEEQRRPFYLYVDEFQNFATKTFATILSEARKYNLNLIIAHQFIDQLSVGGKEEIRDAVFGNCGTYIIFRTSAKDAEFLEKEFMPVFNKSDIANIDQYVAYVKLMVKGTATRGFSMSTIYINEPNQELGEAIRQLSRLKFGREREEVDEEIKRRLKLLG